MLLLVCSTNYRIEGDFLKKFHKYIKSNIKLVIGILIGAVLSGTTVYAATILFNSNQVVYDNSSSGATSTNVQGALDELYTKANTRIYPNDFGIKRNTAKNVMATPGGVCIKRNGTVHCLTTNNWDFEQNHIQQVFSDGYCTVASDYVDCFASDFSCDISSTGRADCSAQSDNSICYVWSSGSVECR
jgi:hypothetical protein